VYIFPAEGPDKPKHFGTAIKVGANNTYTVVLGWCLFVTSTLLLKLIVVCSPFLSKEEMQ
jgi:hypothetical protein